MGVVLVRTLHSVISVAITYVVSSILFSSRGFFSGLLTLILYAGISLGVAWGFRGKTWIPIASGVVGYFWILLGNLQYLNGLTVWLTAVMLVIVWLLVPKYLFRGKGRGGSGGGNSKRPPYLGGLERLFSGLKSKGTGGGRSSSRDHTGGLPTRGIGVYGEPGAGLGKAVKMFGEAKVAAGVLGEQESCRVLAQEFRNSNSPVALVNSIQFAGSKTADVDHALISGKNVFLIDSKKYRDGTYMATSSNTIAVKSTDGRIRKKRVRMDSALENYRKILPGARFPKAYVMIHSKGDVIPKEIGGVFFGAPNQVVRDLKNQIGSGSAAIDGNVFSAINSRRK